MQIEKIINTIRANAGNRLRVTFSDELVQTVVVGSVDDEGFTHSGPDCADPYAFWTRFEEVKVLETDAQ